MSIFTEYSNNKRCPYYNNTYQKVYKTIKYISSGSLRWFSTIVITSGFFCLINFLNFLIPFSFIATCHWPPNPYENLLRLLRHDCLLFVTPNQMSIPFCHKYGIGENHYCCPLRSVCPLFFSFLLIYGNFKSMYSSIITLGPTFSAFVLQSDRKMLI